MEAHAGISDTRGDAFFRGATPVWLLAVLGFLVLLYAGIARALAVQWADDPNYNHGFLVPLLAGWLVFERREKLQALAARPWLGGVTVLLAGCFLLVLGRIGAELFLQRISFVVVLYGLVLLALGSAFARVLAFPLAFLVFMVPLPEIVLNAVAFPLQLFAARTAELCLFTLGIPVLREGNVIELAQTTLQVAEACSGIRSLQALLTLSVLYAWLTQRALWKRTLLVLAAVPIAVATNALRVSGTGILAHYYGTEVAHGFYHGFAGWLTFVVAFLVLLAFGALLHRVGRRAPEAAA